MTDRDANAELRSIPQVERLLASDAFRPLVEGASRAAVAGALRQVLDGLRADILAGGAAGDRLEPASIASAVAGAMRTAAARRYVRAINGTGIVLHTGLGRAPLAEEARRAIARAAGYAVVEVDPETGERSRREDALAETLRAITGAEAAFAVNNNAGATLLILAALARGREVVVSRGELIEIGGSFRLPEILEASGARLVAVGTTNRTYLRDYEAAIGDATSLLMKAHTSNYRIVGFTEDAAIGELSALARARGIPLLHDLGSGCVIEEGPPVLADEPRVRRSLAEGADLVCFSADKLLGAPQGGIILGRKDLVERIRRHPIARAVRLDKLALAGLQATLEIYQDPARILERIPALRLLAAPVEEIERRGRALIERLRGADPDLEIALVPSTAQAGSGSLPGLEIPSRAIAVRSRTRGPDRLARALRLGETPIFGRIQDDRLRIDLRTVAPDEEEIVERALRALGAGTE
ncbi:MAG: L-seryl-tRNA(Sec) selenium transferase [Planctomycetes bacterium]|nr:L-seryl-tRNA(Sec) selenium transferase [Planctomycetota bacterium]